MLRRILGSSVRRQNLYWLPINYWSPKIANKTKVRPRKIDTPKRPGNEANNVCTICLSLGIRLTVLRGLKILKVRSDLSAALLTWGRNPTKEIITTIKSSQFHKSLRYEFLWKMNPKAMILIVHSKMKMTENARSIWLRMKFRGDQ